MTGTAGAPTEAATAAGSTAPGNAGAERRAAAWRRQLDATAAAVGLAGLIAVLEINRLSTSVLDRELVSRGISEVSGLLAGWKTDIWDHWSALRNEPLIEGADSIAGWIAWTGAFDLLFIAGYAWLLGRLVAASTTAAALGSLVVLVAADVVETVLLWGGAAFLQWSDHVPAALRWALVAAAYLKWLGLLVLVIALLRDQAFRTAFNRGLVRVFRAVRVQRMSFVIVVIIAALTLVPGPNISDQFPDVVRGWFDAKSPQATSHLIAGVVAYLAAGAVLFVLGRQRSERSWETYVGHTEAGPRPPGRPTPHRLWLLGPVAAFGIALVLDRTGHSDLIDGRVLSAFILVPVVLLVASIVVVWIRGDALWSEPGNTRDEDRARRVWVTGDLLAAALPVVGALATVRALTAPTILGAAEEREVHWFLRLVVLIVAFGVLILAFSVVGRLWRSFDEGDLAPGRFLRVRELLRPDARIRSTSLLHRPVPLASWLVAVAVLAALTLFPLQIAQGIGVLAVTLAALTAWALVLGFLIVHLQHHQPLEVFRALHLRAVPLLTLFAVVPLIATVLGGVEGLHDVRTRPEATGPPDRPSMARAFELWLSRGEGCEVSVGTATVRPMVLVAASGGGIRAATWTAGVLAQLQAVEPCGRSAVFLSSGVSGGSVGLAASRGPDPMGDLEDIARPTALAAALAGTLVGDLVAGSSGLRIPSAVDDGWTPDVPDDSWDWRDRAGLMETLWEHESSALSQPYDGEVAGPGGTLVLNSTDARTGCRVLVSQVDLQPDPDSEDGRSADTGTADVPDPLCRGAGPGVAASIDLFEEFRDCSPAMTWATAAMLSARFATVTPAGRVPSGRCSGLEELQLIDGGYAESSGLGTLTDLAPAILQPVLEHNATLGDGEALVVPVVLYLEDEPRTEIARGAPPVIPELLVPWEGTNAETVQTATATWLQRAGSAYADPCGDDAADACAAVVRALHEQLGNGVVVAAPLTRPAVEVPLGWTLSDDSRGRLSEDLLALTSPCTTTPEPGADDGGRPDYACMERLTALLRSAG